MKLAVALILAAACGAAAYPGVRATRDLQWPGDPDFTRDIAAAETIAAGNPLSDPFYRDEWIWYNPAVPAMVAGFAAGTGLPIPLVYARLGAYLNLLVPLALFGMVSSWWGPLRGLAAVVALLFLVPGTEPGWLTASYSPWLFPMHVGQAAFYVAMAAVGVAWRTRSSMAFATAGMISGAAFLTHTAPALLIAGAMAVEIACTWFRGRDAMRSSLTSTAVFVAAAAAVASPFLVSIVGHYRLRILNPAPALYVLPELLLSNAWDFWRSALAPSVVGLVAVVGSMSLVWRRHEVEARLVLSAAATAGALLLYTYWLQTDAAAAHAQVAFVPGHHFLYYLRAFEAIAFAVGLATVAAWIARSLGRMQFLAPSPTKVYAGLIGVALTFAAWRYPIYASRYDFVAARTIATGMFADNRLGSMYRWLREHTSPDDVVLAPPNLAQSVVATAGRKVIVVDKFFSNPYVDWLVRARDRDAMMEALVSGDWTRFWSLAVQYRVRYVAHYGDLHPAVVRTSRLSVVWNDGGWTLYSVGHHEPR